MEKIFRLQAHRQKLQQYVSATPNWEGQGTEEYVDFESVILRKKEELEQTSGNYRYINIHVTEVPFSEIEETIAKEQKEIDSNNTWINFHNSQIKSMQRKNEEYERENLERQEKIDSLKTTFHLD